MCELEMLIPEYVRINRTYRDIPASEILHGSTLSNLRQLVEDKLVSQGRIMTDIRSREIKDKTNNPNDAVLKTFKYEASDGIEYFMTYEDPEDRTIFSMLRLRIPSSIVNPGSQQTFEMTTDDAKAQAENKDPDRVLLPSITDYLPELT
jgi:elongator complex protein 3